MPRYNPSLIEPKWQHYWEQQRTFAAPRLPRGEKLYILDMFPYPSGDGLHVGHPEGYTATDILCRYWRMRGKSVLHPMGFDAFGLPAEEHAIRTNTPPRASTERNIATFRRQLKSLGFSYDWDRELATTDLEYFKWTQWIFLQIYDTWFDEAQQKGRPIAELPIPPEVRAQGNDAVRAYQDARRLAYQAEAPVNWCPMLGTVLANEEVIDGKSERGGHPVVRIPLRQWMLRITAYAERLEKDLDSLDWPHGIKKLQRDWIGKSAGAEVDFYLGPRSGFSPWAEARGKTGFPAQPGDDVLRVYTTRPDTLFGATYMVLAPEHPLVARLTTPEQSAAVAAYCQQASTKSDLDRTELAKEKTGVFTGAYAINPVNGQPIPIWLADYVLISYGTGAIMAVPAHDLRDWEFAVKFSLPIIPVVQPPEGYTPTREEKALQREINGRIECPFTGPGTAINSGMYNGQPTAEFKQRITTDLAAAGLGQTAVKYKLRDWLFSRQRFWGEPFPLLHELGPDGKPNGKVRPVPIGQLPVNLPDIEDYKPHGRPEPPLDKAPHDWLYPMVGGTRYKRETNTMPQWAGSCWYYLRFLDPHNDKAFVDREVEKAWMPVDVYVGGAEHAVLHLLYARFWHKVLYDRGYVSTPEPFRKLVNQGMILGEAQYHVAEESYRRHEQLLAEHGIVGVAAPQDGDKLTYALMNRDASGNLSNLSEDQTEKRQGTVYLKGTEIALTPRADKMSKSRGNVVNPDAIVSEYGADSLRLYEMFMGPLEATKPWSMSGVNGVRGFLDRVWRMIVDDRAEHPKLYHAVKNVPCDAEQNRVLHRTIKAVTEDIESFSFNTAIARLMEFTNYFGKLDPRPKGALEQFVLLLSPFAPHIAEELWQLLGHGQTLAYERWPEYDEALTREATIEVPVQVNGKLRGKASVAADCGQAELEAAARASVAEQLAGKSVVKVVVVPGRLVNFVVK